jgi:hypothetical protein
MPVVNFPRSSTHGSCAAHARFLQRHECSGHALSASQARQRWFDRVVGMLPAGRARNLLFLRTAPATEASRSEFRATPSAGAENSHVCGEFSQSTAGDS